MGSVGAKIHGPTDGRFLTAARYSELNDATRIAAMNHRFLPTRCVRPGCSTRA
jgi:hypothetical protein